MVPDEGGSDSFNSIFTQLTVQKDFPAVLKFLTLVLPDKVQVLFVTHLNTTKLSQNYYKTYSCQKP
jgi:hypothetical protein